MEPRAPTPLAEFPAEPPAERPRARVLVVNDDEDSLYLLARSIRQALPEAELALRESALEALAHFHQGRVDAVVTDHKMPEMDGLTFVRHIRERDSQVPILMVTGSLGLTDRAAQAGVTLCLSRLCWSEIGTELKNLLPVQWK